MKYFKMILCIVMIITYSVYDCTPDEIHIWVCMLLYSWVDILSSKE